MKRDYYYNKLKISTSYNDCDSFVLANNIGGFHRQFSNRINGGNDRLYCLAIFQFYVFAFMGFGTFMPKYVEYQFRQKGSASSTFAGGVGTVSKAIGLLVSYTKVLNWQIT
jgi:hypothetical protein